MRRLTGLGPGSGGDSEGGYILLLLPYACDPRGPAYNSIGLLVFLALWEQS